MIESDPIPISQVAKWLRLRSHNVERQYKNHLSHFREWEQKRKEKGKEVEGLVYPENFGKRMSIDEVALSRGELYTVITNKERGGKKGALAAIVKGTKNEVVTEALKNVPVAKRMEVEEITADLASSMDWIIRTNFMNATMTADRFHVQQIVTEALQEIRIGLRRESINQENERIMEARREKIPYTSKLLSNGDTEKQLLARSRYLLFKNPNGWTTSQQERAVLLFSRYPQLKKAYDLSLCFRNIFEKKQDRESAKKDLRSWYQKISNAEIPQLISAGNTIQQNEGKILNYFINRETNASAESFNAKIKGFRALLRGVRDVNFFLFRLETLYA